MTSDHKWTLETHLGRHVNARCEQGISFRGRLKVSSGGDGWHALLTRRRSEHRMINSCKCLTRCWGWILTVWLTEWILGRDLSRATHNNESPQLLLLISQRNPLKTDWEDFQVDSERHEIFSHYTNGFHLLFCIYSDNLILISVMQWRECVFCSLTDINVGAVRGEGEGFMVAQLIISVPNVN